MTRAAQEFVKPLTFAALSGEKVITGMFSRGEEHEPNIDSAIEHIAVAQSIDALRCRSRYRRCSRSLRAGNRQRFPDNALSGDHRARRGRAGDECQHVESSGDASQSRDPAQTRREDRRTRSGYLACGMAGQGRLAENEAIVAAVLETLGRVAGSRGRDRAHHRRSHA